MQSKRSQIVHCNKKKEGKSHIAIKRKRKPYVTIINFVISFQACMVDYGHNIAPRRNKKKTRSSVEKCKLSILFIFYFCYSANSLVGCFLPPNK